MFATHHDRLWAGHRKSALAASPGIELLRYAPQKHQRLGVDFGCGESKGLNTLGDPAQRGDDKCKYQIPPGARVYGGMDDGAIGSVKVDIARKVYVSCTRVVVNQLHVLPSVPEVDARERDIVSSEHAQSNPVQAPGVQAQRGSVDDGCIAIKV